MAARKLGVEVATVKRAVNALLFGMSLERWRQSQGIRSGGGLEALSRLEKEVVHARSLVVRRERKEGTVREGEKETTVLSRAVEREETKIMKNLITKLQEKGWETTTLIHDEVILEPKYHVERREEEK